jgi:beta-N-acetylhexosaminidase
MTIRRYSRRSFLAALASGSAALLAACSDTSSADPPPDATNQSPTASPPPATPTTRPGPTATTAPQASLEEMVAQMLMVGFAGQTANTGDGTVAAISNGRLGNTVLFDRNIASPPQLKTLDAGLQAMASSPLLISTDEEGGYVARLRPANGFPDTVSAEYLGNQNDLDLTYRYASSMARALRDSGINLNLAPDVDVNVNPANPVIGQYERSFSADPNVVAEQALTFIRAHHDVGVLCTLKHFAGHGSSTADSHLGIVDVTNTWSEKELIPFQRVIDAGQADAIMTAHIFNANIDPEFPGTLSKPTITGLLREKMGYDGVVITDDMQMGAIRQYFGFERAVELAIVAGADIIAIANTLAYDAGEAAAAFGAVMAAVSKGSVSEAHIEQSYKRIQRLKSRIA